MWKQEKRNAEARKKKCRSMKQEKQKHETRKAEA